MTTQSATLIPTGTWTVDTAHSKVGFSVKHMGISTVRGEFTEFEGSMEIGESPSDIKVHGKVKTASVDTNEDARDEHLRSPDFFEAETHPELSFESTRVEAIDEDTYRITGDMTLRGVTNELVLTAELNGVEDGMDGGQRVGLEVTGQLSRGEYGMKFNQALGSGNMLVSDKVKLTLDIAATKQ
ncbi:MAG: YceI family protein [Solirubrobacterales bacterium]|nr:YceI family protein [Solirubrobacterales bacterium]